MSELQHFQLAPLPKTAKVTYCITGTLSDPRNEVIHWLASYGWHFVNTVTRYTNYLIVGELNKETIKQKRAKELGVAIVYEHQLPQLLKHKEPADERRNE
jgi:DNA ligase (NAD+)